MNGGITLSKTNYVNISLEGTRKGQSYQINALRKGIVFMKTKAQIRPLNFIIKLAKRIFSLREVFTKVSLELKQYFKSENLHEPLELINASERLEAYKSTFLSPLK